MFNRSFSFFGNSITISAKEKIAEKKMLINEKKTENSEGISRITIYSSNIDIRVTASETSDIEAHLKSYAYTDGKVSLDTKLVEDELIIMAELVNAKVFFGDITLNISIPSGKVFDQIKVEGTSADLEIIDRISANSIDVTTHSGDVTIHKANAREGIQVKTSSGDVEVSKEVSTVVLEIETKKGDVELENIISKKCIQIKTTSGDIEIGNGIMTERLKIDADSSDIEIDGSFSMKVLEVMTINGEVEIGNHVSADSLKIETKSGDIETNAKFINATINTHSGDVDVSTKAKQDITLNVTTTKGDVEIDLINVGPLKLSPRTKTGDIDCEHADRGGYSAEVTVTTVSGDIEIS